MTLTIQKIKIQEFRKQKTYMLFCKELFENYIDLCCENDSEELNQNQ